MINTQMIDNVDEYATVLCGFRENAIYRLQYMLKELDQYREDIYQDKVDRMLWMIEDECRYICMLTDDIDHILRHEQSKGGIKL